MGFALALSKDICLHESEASLAGICLFIVTVLRFDSLTFPRAGVCALALSKDVVLTGVRKSEMS